MMGSKTRLPIRFLVLDVSKDVRKAEVNAILQPALSINNNYVKYKCVLKNFWFTTSIKSGDFVNIFDPKIIDEPNDEKYASTIVIDNVNGLLVINPDILISATTLMSAHYCMRKSWLTRLFEIFGETNLAFVIGNVVHELFQESLKRGLFSIGDIENLFMNEILKTLTLDLYSMNMSQEELISYVKPYFYTISSWLTTYLNKDSKNTLFDIHRLHDIENTIWSTKYGFIGKLDLSLEVNLVDQTSLVRSRSLVPLELKTGRSSHSFQHIGQVILYSFIMADKYPNLKPSDGFLLYLKDECKTEPIKCNHNVFRDLIILRNNFVQYYDRLSVISSKNDEFVFKGPEPTTSERKCLNCEHLLDCSLVYKCFDSKNLPSVNFELSNKTTSHLSNEDLEFFSKMISLLEIEKQYCVAQDDSVHFWNLRSEDCEFSGIGLSKIKISAQSTRTILFTRHPKALQMLPTKLLTSNSDLSTNYSLLEDRRVVISEELFSSLKTFEIFGNFCKQLCVTIGKVDYFSTDLSSISIILEKDQINLLNPNAIYRIDFLKNISNKAMQINYSNMLRLMADDAKAKELRDVVIRGHIQKLNLNSCKVPELSRILDSPLLGKLNVQQKKAVIGVLKTKYSLIFGSPGSGKTQTIVALVQILVSLGFSVLLTSFTHVAVDNILLKVVQANQENLLEVDFLRIGSIKRIHSLLEKYSDYNRTKEWIETGNLSGIENLYTTIPVVASTCLGMFSHPLFAKRTFDFCILDEASQVYLATCVGPIFSSQNFVLVGDQKQLPPVIKNQTARKQGLEESLFARLLKFADKNNILTSNSTQIEQSFSNFEDYISKNNRVSLDTIRVFPLFIQYRMNCIIMELANKLTYFGNLKCATEQIESTCLHSFIPEVSSTVSICDYTYLQKAVSPNLEDSVVFIDTSDIVQGVEICSTCSAPPLATRNLKEQGKHAIGYVHNDFEATLIALLIQTLHAIYSKGGFTYSNIGVISPFQRQVLRIRELIGEEFAQQNMLEINTVDQYQGRDKDIIIYSCVKSHLKCEDINESQDTDSQSISSKEIIDSALLKDERRLNVAITRAKKKLIIIGNRNTLDRYEPFQKLFSVLKAQQFVKLSQYDLHDSLVKV